MSTTEKGWLSINEAAQYAGISSDLIRRAIAQHDLPAYQKPITRGHREGAQRKVWLKVARSDVDAWVRSWPSAWD